jgi:hypothetical protein
MQEVFLEWQVEIMRASGMTPYQTPPTNYPPGQYPQQQPVDPRQGMYGAPQQQQQYAQGQGYPPTPQQSPGYFPATPQSPAPPYQYPYSPQTPQTPYASPQQQSPQFANGPMVTARPGALPVQTSRDVSSIIRPIYGTNTNVICHVE